MSYLGSKAASGAYQAIIAAMPAHDTYIETHLGTGAIMKYKPLASRSIGIDIDKADDGGVILDRSDIVPFGNLAAEALDIKHEIAGGHGIERNGVPG